MEKNNDLDKELFNDIDSLLQYVNLSENSKVLNVNTTTNFLKLLKKNIGCEVINYSNDDNEKNEEVFNDSYDVIFDILPTYKSQTKQDFIDLILKYKKSITEYGLIIMEVDNPDCIKFLEGAEYESDFEDIYTIDKYLAISLDEIEQIFEENGLYLLDVFSDSKLHKFSKTDSENMLLIFK